MNKKNILRNRLFEEDIDIACIQETHLNPNNMFSIRDINQLLESTEKEDIKEAF